MPWASCMLGVGAPRARPGGQQAEGTRSESQLVRGSWGGRGQGLAWAPAPSLTPGPACVSAPCLVVLPSLMMSNGIVFTH